MNFVNKSLDLALAALAHIVAGCDDHLEIHIVEDIMAMGFEPHPLMVVVTASTARGLYALPENKRKAVIAELREFVLKDVGGSGDNIRLTTTKVANA